MQESTKHTPGPWVYVDAQTRPEMGYQPMCVIRAGDKQIASFSWNDNSRWFPSKAEGRRNARLIAAAPELLAFAQRYLDSEATTAECDALAKAAIAKATGGAA